MCDGCGCNRPAKITATVGACLLPIGLALSVVSWQAWNDYRSSILEKETNMLVEGKTQFSFTGRGDIYPEGATFGFYSDDPADCEARAQSIHIRELSSGATFNLSTAECAMPVNSRPRIDWKGQRLVMIGIILPGSHVDSDWWGSSPKPVWVTGERRSNPAYNMVEEQKIAVLGFCGHVLGIGGTITLFVSLCLMCCCQPPKPVEARELLLALHQAQPAQTVQAPVAVVTPLQAEPVST